MLDQLSKGFEAWRQASFQPFGFPLFRALWIAAFVSNLGAAIQTVGASWSMISMTESPQLVALVQTAAMLPIVILALPAGALADNMDRRGLMLASQILGALSAAILSLLSFTSQLTPTSLLACTALIGSAVALYQPAWQASLADLVPRKSLPAAVSLNVLAFNAARSIGPAIGGGVIAFTGSFAAFALNSLSFLGLIIVLAIVRFDTAARRHPPEPIIPAIVAGLRFVSLSPDLLRIYLRAGLFGLGASAVWSLLPLVAESHLGGGPMIFGLLVGALGAGSLCGAVVATWVRSLVGNNRMVTFSVAGFGGGALGIAISPWPLLSAAFAFLSGISWIFVFTTTRTCVQLSSPRWVVGRTVSLGQVASFGCMSVGAAAWGALASQIGTTDTLIVSAAFMGLSVLAAIPAPLPATDLEEPSSLIESRPRAPPVEIDSGLGPVVITIEYDVPPDRTDAFIVLINQLGRVRRRNGATRWTIQQDIDRPEIWVERIVCPRWIDHLRRLDRYSSSDRQLVARADAFRIQGQRAVRRMIELPRGSPPLR